ncbi:MAG: DNA-directed RNA polymerase subunit beta [Clostridia bacterium]|nr:DNA-directed RNA polymerase subunit beta [Clostridia bacterium]
MAKRVHTEKFGNTERYSFSKIKNVLEIPNLISIQKNSYNDFIQNGIKEVLQYYSPIVSQNGKLVLIYKRHFLADKPKNSIQYCKDNALNYEASLHVEYELQNLDAGDSKIESVYIGDIPLMTESGSFIINGAERVVVSQLIRSPGVYCEFETDKRTGKKRYKTRLSPERGDWLEFEQDQQGISWVHINKKRKILTSILIRSLAIVEGYPPISENRFQKNSLRHGLGTGTNEEIIEFFGNDPMIIATLNKDGKGKNSSIGLKDLYSKMKDNDGFTIPGGLDIINSTFFEERKYDLTRVGRYKVNKKLNLATRIAGQKLSRDVKFGQNAGDLSGIILSAGTVLTLEEANQIQNAGINVVWVAYTDENGNEKEFKMMGNNHVDLEAFVPAYPDGTPLNPKDLGILEKVYYPELAEMMDEYPNLEDLISHIKENVNKLVRKTATPDDILATINYDFGLTHGFGKTDDIDHLSNRRVRAIGELLQNQFRIGISRLEKGVREKMQSTAEGTELKPKTLINTKPVETALRTFFGSSQLSQFMDQPNPIAELTHKRKLSALGPGGLNRERATMAVRDVHHSHYGRICPIETPEGQNIGLISSLATYARINEYGYIESPYRKIDKATGVITDEVVYMTAEEEDKYIIAQANEPLDENSRFVNDRVTCREMEKIREYPKEKVDYMDVNPKQLVSVATALIPFLENDDLNRALMGSNMQRQAVPLLKPEAPIVATGVEYRIAHDSGVVVIAKNAGVVKYVDADNIVISTDDGKEDTYQLSKFQRSNQNTCINQHPIVSKGERVEADQVIADGPATDNGELSLGRNILIGFMEWEGYNYEDAVLISEDLLKNDAFTSIHIQSYECESRETKLGPEEITRDIAGLSANAKKHLDENGIVRVGTEVKPGDILVGKITKKGETEPTAEQRLLAAIFQEKSGDYRDTSLRVKNGEGGIVVDVQVFKAEDHAELANGVLEKVKVFIAQKRKIGVGDKMAGRHGNKGVVSRVLPREDMPFLEDGTPLQIVLNPLGVPSRMNIGQVLEVHLGLVAHSLGWKICTPVFDGANEKDIKALLRDNGFVSPVYNADGTPKLDENGNPVTKVDGKIKVYDGRTGEPFENPVTVGYMYYLKLHHLVDDKIHARSIGPYSLVTQQPLGGKAQFGGQRFGEMEVWALEAYGAAHTLQEILTVKSDDVEGRNRTYNSIINGQNLSEPGIPEAFHVLVKELNALGLNIEMQTEDGTRISQESISSEELEYDMAQRKNEEEKKEVDVTENFSMDSLYNGTASDNDEDAYAGDNNELDMENIFGSLDDAAPTLEEEVDDEFSKLMTHLEDHDDDDNQ